jgi:chromosomal replication initiator protein
MILNVINVMKKEMKIGKILEIVSNHFNISKDDLLS